MKVEPGVELDWRCVDGHDPWTNNTFPFQLSPLDDGRTRLRFRQDYAVELSDDAYCIYNFNWAYYLNSLLFALHDGRRQTIRSGSGRQGGTQIVPAVSRLRPL